MAGRTGYTPITNADPMLGPEQITEVYEHFDPLIGESRASAGALPTSGNWLGRIIMAEDTGALYVCTALPGTWKRYTAARMASGTVAVPGSGGGSSAPVFYSDSLTVTFPVGLFSAIPHVSFTYEGPGVGWADKGSTATSTTGTTARAHRIGAAPSGSVSWLAVQL